MNGKNIIKFSAQKDLLNYAINRLEKTSYEAIKLKGIYNVVLSGGATPKFIYSELTNISTDWDKWCFWFGDERCFDMEHNDSNHNMVKKALFQHVPIPSCNIRRIKVELGIERAVKEYGKDIESVDIFDQVLLGLGEDGHTASLFPEHDIGVDEKADDVLAVYNSPKPPNERVSLSVKRLNRSREIIFICTGKNKKKAIEKFKNNSDIPANKIKGLERTTLLYCPENII